MTFDLEKVPIEYYQYVEVFSKNKSRQILLYQLYDLSILLEKETILSLELIYSLFMLELQMLRKFINKNIYTGFIHPSWLPCSILVLFVKKKNGLLRLCVDYCVDYCGLNWLIQKNRYLIPLLLDLLDIPKKARIYTKINLHNAYHLVYYYEMTPKKETISHTFINLMGNIQKYNMGKI